MATTWCNIKKAKVRGEAWRRRCGASGAAGRLRTLRARQGLLFGQCRGQRGPEEQLRRMREGKRPLPAKGARRCDFLTGMGQASREELAEAEGEEVSHARVAREERG